MQTIPFKPTKQQIADFVREPSTVGGRLQAGGFNSYSKLIHGSNRLLAAVKIMTTGPLGTEADYTDYRYWAQFEQNSITNEHYQIGDTINLQDSAKPITTVYNFSEFPSKSHSLAPKSIVSVGLFYVDQVLATDQLAKPQLRWCVLAAVGGIFPVHVTKDSGAFTPTLTATYTVKDINDNDLRDGTSSTSTMKTPKYRWASAAALFAFQTVADGSDGMAYYKNGALILNSVAQEWPLAGLCAGIGSG